jgi:hypothetical protein
MFPLVSIMLFLPLFGATLLELMRGSPPRLAHAVGIVASGLTLLGSLLLIWARGVAGEGFSQVEEVAWIPSLNAAYRVGVDGISLPLVLMTAVLFFVSLLFSAHITEWARSYVALFLLLETASIGVFVALDAVLFYVFFEVTLVGMYFVISGWGYEGRQRAALTFFLYTLLGLKWTDLDLERGTLGVNRSMDTLYGPPEEKAPKRQSSRRTIALVPEAVAALRVRKKRQAEAKLATGPAWQERDLIFSTRIGTPMRGDNLLKRSLRPLLEKADLPPLTFHELRHTFATFQLAAVERPKVVQEILGHSSIKTTMDTYSHVIPGMQEEAAGRLQRLLFGPTPVTLPSDNENANRSDEERQAKSSVCRGIRGALGRTRTCDLLIRSLNTFVLGCLLVSNNWHT